MSKSAFPSPPRQTANPAPERPAGSLRRTCSIDVSWPDGAASNRLLQCRARDYLTARSGKSGEVLAEAWCDVRMAEDKTIYAITGDPAPANLQTLVGERGGGHLRLVLRERLPELLEQAAPLYLALDDLSGTALVSAFALTQYDENWMERIRSRLPAGELERMMESRINVCWGLAEGNSGLDAGRTPSRVADAEAGELVNPADPLGWHTLPETSGPGFRRARRIDVTRDPAAGLLRVDSAFQDSARLQQGGRVAIHEYSVRVTADLASGTIITLEPQAHILPFPECPGAMANAQRLVGSTLQKVRDTVLAELRGTQGCTHLNDALRALADVPRLAERLAA